MVVLLPGSVADVQAKIASTAAMGAQYDLTPTEFPVVFRENGDWAQYVDEYQADGFTMRDPGVCIIDQAGNFYAANAFMRVAHTGIDWVVRRVDELLGARQPVDTILALDRSGSMGYPPPSGGSPENKIDILKDAVGVFLEVWAANAVPGDRVGVVDFSGDVNQYCDMVLGELVPVPDSVADVEAYVLGLTHGGITCIGGAVATALDDLAVSGRRHIILFSDGIQNCNPVLVEDSPFLQILHIEPAAAGAYPWVEGIFGDSGVPPKPGIDLEDFDTRVHTIGVGLSGPPWSDLLCEIALESRGLHFETPAPEVDLQNFYLNDLLESFKGATPQLVQNPRGTFYPEKGYALDRCQINSSARWLTVALTWQGDPDRSQLLCSLEAPDGTLLEIDSRTAAAPRRRVISLPLPTYHYDRLVGHAGEWRLHIRGVAETNVPYQVFWIVDDRRVHFEIPTLDRRYRVGDTLLLKARLRVDGKPFDPDLLTKVSVRTAAPAVDLAEFLESYQPDPAVLERAKERAKELELRSETALKLYALGQDPEAVAHCTRMNVRSKAMAYKEGELVSKVRFTRPGMHRFDLSVDVLDERGFHIKRTRTLNVFVT